MTPTAQTLRGETCHWDLSDDRCALWRLGCLYSTGVMISVRRPVLAPGWAERGIIGDGCAYSRGGMAEVAVVVVAAGSAGE